MRDVRRHEGWVTEDEGKVTAFLTLDWTTDEAGEISWLAVHPDFRRTGRGRQLVEQAMAEASRRGARMLFLFTSAEEDAPEIEDGYEGTRRFYSSLGFVKLWVGRQSGWSEDHLLMVRSL